MSEEMKSTESQITEEDQSLESQDIKNMTDDELDAYDKKLSEKSSEQKSQTTESQEKRIKSLEKQIADLEKIKNDRGNFINQQKLEASDYRKQITALTEKVKQLAEASSQEKYWEDHEKALDARDAKKQAEAELATVTKNAEEFERKSQILSLIPDYENAIDDIIQYFRDEDPTVKESELKFFKENPYNIDPAAVYNFYEKAKIYKRLKLAESGKQKSFNEKIKDASAFKTATSNIGSSESKDGFATKKQISYMTDAEFDAYEKSIKERA